MSDGLSEFDRSLLAGVTRRVPLVREPFAQIAAELDCDQASVLAGLAALKQTGIIRELSGVFDAESLGYSLALCALAVADGAAADAGEVVAAHPGVSHCYQRDAAYNIWFTLAVSPDSSLGLAGTIERMSSLCGGAGHLVLPTLRRYKLHVRFPLHQPERAPAAVATAPRPDPASPSDEQRRAVRALQVDLPVSPDPFAAPAASQSLDADMLLVHAADFLSTGWMRRYAAAIDHRAAGAEANVMVAWQVSEPAADVAGAGCARIPAVSHCYLRAAAGDWPYNLYTMIHGRSREDCEMTIGEIVATTPLEQRAEFWTKHEFKKRRVRLFTDDEARWESAVRPNRSRLECDG